MIVLVTAGNEGLIAICDIISFIIGIPAICGCQACNVLARRRYIIYKPYQSDWYNQFQFQVGILSHCSIGVYLKLLPDTNSCS